MKYELLHLASQLAQMLDAAGVPEGKWQRGLKCDPVQPAPRVTFWWRGKCAILLDDHCAVFVEKERAPSFTVGEPISHLLRTLIREGHV